MFRNRINEIQLLEELYKSNKPKLVILYGRRRVGKSELLIEFAKNHKSLYLVARQESANGQLKKMSEEISKFFNDKVLEANPFKNYDALFIYLLEKEVPVFFDEFPFLVESNKSLPSILQEYWDKSFSRKKSFIILCGSSIRMMESLLGYKSPIYGRRTEQILLEPLKFKDACYFFNSLKKEDKIIYYSVLGGTPAYLLEFDYNKNLLHNIQEKILNKNKFLYQDTLFVLQQELNEPHIYYSIIKSISKGNTKIGNIMNDVGIEKGKITKYLSVLQKLQIIERRVPITEKNKEKSRKGIYMLKDNYFKFWFRFVFGNSDYIEQGLQTKLISSKIEPELNQFVGEAYEEIILEWSKSNFKNYIFGRWWDKNEEIDIVGIDKEKQEMLLGEVKWKELSEEDVLNIFNILLKKSEKIENGFKKELFVVGKKIKSKLKLRKKGHLVYDVDDVV